MKYQPPYGLTDPNAPYINGNPAAGIEGSIPPAAAFEYPMREIVSLIANSNLTPSDADLLQLLKSVRRQWINYAVDTGTANAMAVTMTPPLDTYMAGFPLRVAVAVTNTGATSINVGGLGARAVKRPDGSDLQPGDIVAGMIANLVDSGSVFQLQNALHGVAGTSNTFSVGIPYAADTGAVNAILAIYSPAITTITEGNYIAVKVAHTNTGAVTMAVNALAALPLNRQDGQPLQAGDIFINETILIENHGTYYQLVSYVFSQLVAPRLRGMMADSTGYGSQSFGANVAGGQAIAYYHMTKNQMQTSTFDGLTLAVGAGEDGVWAVYGALHSSLVSADCNFCSVSLFVNNIEQATESQSSLPSGTGTGISVTAHIQLAVGDQLQVRFYNQCPTGMTSTPDNRNRMSAFLISK